MNNHMLVLLFSLCMLFVGIHGHNYLINPVSRANQKDTQTGCRYGGEGNPTCAGPCDRTLSKTTRAPITVQRGQTIQVNWYRHTHPGGFIRFAWSPTSQSDNHASFDQRVDKIVCKEVGGCGPASSSDPSGGSNGVDCGTTITVPTYLTDGTWTFQWAYFGGWYNAGDYYACTDYTISGGPTGAQQAGYFVGGDYTYPKENVCLFYSTNALHVCTVEPCNNGTFPPGNQKGAALGYGGPIPSTTGKITTGATTGKVTTAKPPITTGKVTTGKPPVTTGKVTTGKPPITTGKPSITTGKPLITTGKPSVTTGIAAITTGTQVTTASQTVTTSASIITTGSSSTEMCYLPGTPNLNGKINSNPPTCGVNARKARCADGQCCSKYGYCGPIKETDGKYYEDGKVITEAYAFYLYCNTTTADYRKVPCATIQTIQDSNIELQDASFASTLNSSIFGCLFASLALVITMT